MNKHIIITPEQAEQIRSKYGKYSAIEPVPIPDGNYIIPERCLSDEDLSEAKVKIEAANGDVQDIVELPETGMVTKGTIFRYEGTYSHLLIVASDHNREEYAHFDPETVPTLFTYFRENSDDLEWIPNEYVKPGWKRVYNGEQYEFTGAGQTLTVEGQTPDLVPAIWTKIHTGEDYPVWVQPTGAHDAYATGVIVHYPTLGDGLWMSKINANTTKPDGDIPYNRYWEPYVI